MTQFIPYHFKGTIPLHGVFFVGLSHKLGKNGEVLDAFCDSTSSGKIISEVISSCKNKSSIHTLNLVSGVPVNENGKIRYPDNREKEKGLQDLIEKIDLFQPKIIFLFGKQVSEFVIKKLKFEQLSDTEYKYGEITFVIVDHPAYIAVYKRKNIGEYVSFILGRISVVG